MRLRGEIVTSTARGYRKEEVERAKRTRRFKKNRKNERFTCGKDALSIFQVNRQDDSRRVLFVLEKGRVTKTARLIMAAQSQALRTNNIEVKNRLFEMYNMQRER